MLMQPRCVWHSNIWAKAAGAASFTLQSCWAMPRPAPAHSQHYLTLTAVLPPCCNPWGTWQQPGLATALPGKSSNEVAKFFPA